MKGKENILLAGIMERVKLMRINIIPALHVTKCAYQGFWLFVGCM
jgi:hypothetical protein